jgi:DNA-binding GntR family transcriptional regulator
VATPSIPELREIAEACRLLEGHLMRQAVPRLTAVTLEEAETLLDKMDKEDRVLEWRQLNWAFHAKLYDPAQRPFLVDWVGALRARAELAMTLLVAEKGRRAKLNLEHRQILDALRRRRPALAIRRLEAHLEGGKEKVMSLLAAPGSERPG